MFKQLIKNHEEWRKFLTNTVGTLENAKKKNFQANIKLYDYKPDCYPFVIIYTDRIVNGEDWEITSYHIINLKDFIYQ